jgi:hypothetical protein
MTPGRGSRRRRRWVGGAVVTGVVPAIVVIGLTGGEPSAPTGGAPAPTAVVAPTGTPAGTPAPSPSATPTTTSTPESQGEALALLETLPVKGRAPKTGYDRDQFGPAWTDADGNGCDTRNDILSRDLVKTAVDVDGCTVRSGLLAGPYSGSWIPFVRGNNTSALVQIDHVVSLSDAWQKGAQRLTPSQREQLANDPLNLLAVDGGLNQAKSDADAATWLPPNKEFRCQLVARQVAVKARYELWVTQAERVAISRILSACPGEALPLDHAAPKVDPTGTPPAQPFTSTPSERSDAGSTRQSFPSCSEAREAGAAPVYRDDPGYGSHLDGDGDGVGCE